MKKMTDINGLAAVRKIRDYLKDHGHMMWAFLDDNGNVIRTEVIAQSKVKKLLPFLPYASEKKNDFPDYDGDVELQAYNPHLQAYEPVFARIDGLIYC